ncbi:hypothetical protein CDD83_2490 [Cordyceps sp. RAO-2017]|nr:hypothetical protein CDD83_2490 [Cordyceps sp. RAO-2017]
MGRESVFLAGSVVLAAYLGWSLAEYVALRVAHHQLAPPYASSYACPAWLGLVLGPLLVGAWRRYGLERKMRLHGARPGAVYPHRDPLLGSDWVRLMLRAMRSDSLLETWHRLFTQTVGHTFWVQLVGGRVLMTCEPDNVKAVLSGQFEAWPIGGVRLRSIGFVLGPHAIFTSNGADWARQRALIRPTFVRNQIADLECTDRHVENLLARLRSSVANGDAKLDLQPLLYMFTMDTSTDFMFGYSTDMLVNPTDEAVQFTRAYEYALLSAVSSARLGWLLTLMPDKKLNESVAYCRAFVDGHVAKALSQSKRKERPYVFMNELIDAGTPPSQITDQLLAMILGGRDTSASMMSSLFWVLARRPDVVRAIRLELAALDGRKPSWEELKGLKYLNNVLKEALRLWPPVPSNMRTASRDVVLPKGGGPDGQSPLFVPKGTECRFSMYSLQRRKDLYGEDAEEFRPERWDTLRTSWEYVPFSGGPRVCIGQQFALTMVSYLTARIFQLFEKVEPRDERPMVHKASSTTSMPNGCWVALTPA